MTLPGTLAQETVEDEILVGPRGRPLRLPLTGIGLCGDVRLCLVRSVERAAHAAPTEANGHAGKNDAELSTFHVTTPGSFTNRGSAGEPPARRPPSSPLLARPG